MSATHNEVKLVSKDVVTIGDRGMEHKGSDCHRPCNTIEIHRLPSLRNLLLHAPRLIHFNKVQPDQYQPALRENSYLSAAPKIEAMARI
jgi:hypothetical protein